MRAQDEEIEAQGACPASPIAHVLVEGDRVVTANAAARALFAPAEPEGRMLADLLAQLPDPPRRVEASPQPSARRLLALVPAPGPEPVDASFGALVREAYLVRLLDRLAAETGAAFAFVGELHGSEGARWVETVAVREDGADAPALRYELARSPSSAEALEALTLHASDAAERFPADAALDASRVEAFAGMPLLDADGHALGLLALLFRAPIADVELVRRLLPRCAPRAAAELERTRFQRRLALGDRRYRELMEDAEDGIVVFQSRAPVFANAAAARILAWPSAEALLREVDDVVDLVSEKDRALVLRQAAARMGGEPAENVFEIGARRRDGRVVPVQVSASGHTWKGAPALQVLIVDLSARKEREARVRQAERMASLGKLTGGIAHDFNNLLAVILGNLDFAAEEAEGATGQAVRKARIAAQRGAELTERLLTFARRQALRPRTVATQRLLEETRGLLTPVLGGDIELVVGTGCEASVEVDPAQLQSALINLAVNARDALERGGRVTIDARRVDAETMRVRFPEADEPLGGDHVCIEVSDDGPGMVPEVRAQAFEPFFTTKGARKGTGLGLSMVHGFVKQSRGQIELDSAPGGGTQVRLFLPCATDTAPAEEGRMDAPGNDERPLIGARRRALVVEDEENVREVAVAMLERLGFEVAEAGDGPDARAALDRERYDLLLSDVVLPAGQRGPDIAADALARDPSMAVLFMSGYAESSDFQKFRLTHEFRLVRKPFRFDQLRGEIEAVLEGDPAP
ncbi:MAG: ATP-binding protein [Pseudomonadales bacterium]|nr:ATP-binding protein [Pseudomonadales bacterium]